MVLCNIRIKCLKSLSSGTGAPLRLRMKLLVTVMIIAAAAVDAAPGDAAPDEYRCNDGTSIPLIAVCDKENNCNDGEDESSCSVDCRIRNTAYVRGSTLKVEPGVKSYRQCLKLCRTTEGCMYWTYVARSTDVPKGGRKLNSKEEVEKGVIGRKGRRMNCDLMRGSEPPQRKKGIRWYTSGDRNCQK